MATLTDIFTDACSNLDTYWNHGAAWSVYHQGSTYCFQARSTTADSDPARVITIKSSQPLAGYSLVTISWDQQVSGTTLQTDGLDFALSSDGTNFDTYNQAFRGPISSWAHKSYTIPGDFSSSYLNNNFKIKFKVVGFTGSAYCQIDNIKITPSYTGTRRPLLRPVQRHQVERQFPSLPAAQIVSRVPSATISLTLPSIESAILSSGFTWSAWAAASNTAILIT